MKAQKTTHQVHIQCMLIYSSLNGTFSGGEKLVGYEIHMGDTTPQCMIL